MMSDPVHTGGCLCGAVRYRAQGATGSVCHCHCSLCRRASGAPLVTWASFPRQGFEFTQGAPATYESTAQAERRFCGACGSPLTFWSARDPEWIDVTLATLDAPEALEPTHHIWTSRRLAWLHLDDGLPSYPEFKDQ